MVYSQEKYMSKVFAVEMAYILKSRYYFQSL